MKIRKITAVSTNNLIFFYAVINAAQTNKIIINQWLVLDKNLYIMIFFNHVEIKNTWIGNLPSRNERQSSSCNVIG
jgi:hypothetical protein